VVDSDLLRSLFGPGHETAITHVARLLQVDRKTLQRNLNDIGLHHGFTKLTDAEVDQVVREFFDARPNSGYSYCHAFIRGKGFRVRAS
jgi:hypothetical protein